MPPGREAAAEECSILDYLIKPPRRKSATAVVLSRQGYTSGHKFKVKK